MKKFPFGPPVLVSPLIRGARFALLVAGIVYARAKQKIYDSMEEAWQEKEAAKRVIREKHLAELRKKIAAEERETVKLLESGKLFDTGEDTDDSANNRNDDYSC